jgi:hypothetical protein
MDVQTTTVPGFIGSNSGSAQEKILPKPTPEEEITEISFTVPLIYLNLAVLQKMVGTS